MRARTVLFPLVVLSLGCEPKEAEDPADILAEDPAFLPGSEERELVESEEPVEDPPATYQQCERAHRRIEELRVDIAIDSETDPAKKRRLQEQRSRTLQSSEIASRIRHDALECVAENVSATEAECVASVRREADLDTCTR